MADITDYTSLVTSEHAQRVRFIAWLTALVQGLVDSQNVAASIPGGFDPDFAQGQALDFVGQWIGLTRYLSVPLTGVFFSWGIAGVGWGEGTWLGPYDVSTGLTALPDDTFRTLLKARIAANNWDGTVPGAYAAWAAAFGANQVLIQDNLDMSMLIIWLGSNDAVTLALLLAGLLDLRPAGVRITGYYRPSVQGPIFGWGLENGLIAGWGQGAWIESIS